MEIKRPESIRYVDPFSQNHREYFDHLVAYNKRVQKISTSLFKESLLGIPRDYSLATTGSDARLEKGPVSGMEILLFYNQADIPEIKRRIEDQANMGVLPTLIENHIEVKPIYDGRLGIFVINPGKPNEIRIISPNRVFDAVQLFGDVHTHEEIKNLFYLELQSSLGKDYLDRTSDKTKEHRKVSISGVQRYKGLDLQHFDPVSGVANYNPSAGFWSFKQGPLRAVQYALVRDMIRRIRTLPNEGKAMLELPSNTIQKLHSLEVMDVISINNSSLRDLSDSYKYFLWLYHMSQTVYMREGIKDIRFDIKETSDRCHQLNEICLSKIIKNN